MPFDNYRAAFDLLILSVDKRPPSFPASGFFAVGPLERLEVLGEILRHLSA